MLRTIRSRLLLSFIAITILTASVVGLVAAELMVRYVQQREQAYLTANAEAVARQAATLMEPAIFIDGLGNLARASAFFGNAQIRILDPQGKVLADSGQDESTPGEIWLIGPDSSRVQVGVRSGELFALEPGFIGDDGNAAAIEVWPFPGVVRGDSEHIFSLRRSWGPLGQRFTIETHSESSEADGEAAPLAEPVETSQPLLWRIAYGDPANPPDRKAAQSVTVPVQGATGDLGAVELTGAPSAVVGFAQALQRTLILAGVGATLLAILIGLVVSRALSSPLLALTAAARQMKEGDLNVRAPRSNVEEINELAQQFNQMAKGLQASFVALAAERDALRRFVADASHELRTPVTALRQFIELLQGPAGLDEEVREEFLLESAYQIDRLAWMTGNLLDLSRLDGNLIELELEDHSAEEILRSAAAGRRMAAAEEGIQLRIDCAPNVRVRADRSRLESVLINLLDNGIRYSGGNGEVVLGCRSSESGIEFWVADQGLGIDPDEVTRVFDRFFRGRNQPAGVDKARGSGLGLAITRSIVEAHGGTLGVESKLGEGSRFSFHIPLEARKLDRGT